MPRPLSVFGCVVKTKWVVCARYIAMPRYETCANTWSRIRFRVLWFTFFFPLPPQSLFISTVREVGLACPHRPPTVWRGVKNVGRTLWPVPRVTHSKCKSARRKLVVYFGSKKKKKCANRLAGRARGIARSKIISSLSRLFNHQAVRTSAYSFTIARTSHGFFTAR